MKQETFIAQHREEWDRLEAWLATQRKPDKHATPDAAPFSVQYFPHAYRRVCQQLALARTRAYSPELVERLQALVQAGHQYLYRTRRPEWGLIRRFVSSDFPRLVRAEWRYMLVSALLLFVPMGVMIWLMHYKPELIYSVFDARQVAEFESMYSPAQHVGRLARDSQSDLAMFGFYIMNNVSIAFRTMASGLFAGVGSLAALLANGVMIGAVAGHLTEIGYGRTFWGFVVGHSAPELLAIVISGAAGLKLGLALLAPGRDTRGAALLKAGRVSARLVLGAFVMLVVAALLESYWSSIAWMPLTVKLAFGGFMWVSVLTWLCVGGRHETR